MNPDDLFEKTDDVRIGKKSLVIAFCSAMPSLSNFGLCISEPIDYELANHLKPSGK